MEKVEAEKLIRLSRYVSEVVSSPADLQKTFDTTVNMLRSVLNAECCSIMLLDPAAEVLRIASSTDIDRKLWPAIAAPLGEGFAGKVAKTGQPLLVREAEDNERQDKRQRRRYTSRSFICAPMRSRGRTLGVVNVTNRRDGTAFVSEHLDMVASLANFVALAIENANLLAETDSANRRLHDVLEGIGDGVIAVGTSGEILHHNELAMHYLGLRARNWTGLKLADAVPKDLAPVFEDLFTRTIQQRHHIHEDVQWRLGRNGETKPLTLSTTPLCSHHRGGPAGVVFVIHDMTLHHKISELEKIDEAKNSFLAIISHELRTPLTSIKGATHLLRARIAKDLDEENLHLLKIVEQNSDRLQQQIINVLDVANIQTESTSLTLRSVRLSDIVGRCLKSVRETAESRGVQIVEHHAPDVEPLMMDEEKMVRAIGHLLDNAVKFTPKNGSVTVTSERKGDEVLITVRDTGEGIDPALRDRIFHKFVQGEGPLTRQSGGCGIGLFVARAFAELHGGRIETHNVAGGGCEFSLVLPKVDLGRAFDRQQLTSIDATKAVGTT